MGILLDPGRLADVNDGIVFPGAPGPRAPASRMETGRRYAGLGSSERAQERYKKFIEAGIKLFGTVGYAGAKVKTLCQCAGLSERYFYESFESREHLLSVVYEDLVQQLTRHISSALGGHDDDAGAAVRASLRSVVTFMLTDPRHARIMLVEVVGVSTELEARRHKSMTDFAEQTMVAMLRLGGLNLDGTEAAASGASGGANPALQPPEAVLDFARLTGVSMVGGVNNMLLDAVLGGTTGNVDRIIEASYQLLCNSASGIRRLAGTDNSPRP